MFPHHIGGGSNGEHSFYGGCNLKVHADKLKYLDSNLTLSSNGVPQRSPLAKMMIDHKHIYVLI